MDPAWNAVLLVAAALSLVWLAGLLAFRGPEWLRILALCVGAAVGYGIVHDQITARISIEYFTIGHPRLFLHDDPTPHALAWGVIATWWVGVLIGVPLAIAARRGPARKTTARELVPAVLVLLAAMALCALVGALLLHFGAERQWFVLQGELAQRVPVERQVDFLCAAGAHGASYLAGFAGGLVLVVRTARRRARLTSSSSPRGT